MVLLTHYVVTHNGTWTCRTLEKVQAPTNIISAIIRLAKLKKINN